MSEPRRPKQSRTSDKSAVGEKLKNKPSFRSHSYFLHLLSRVHDWSYCPRLTGLFTVHLAFGEGKGNVLWHLQRAQPTIKRNEKNIYQQKSFIKGIHMSSLCQNCICYSQKH